MFVYPCSIKIHVSGFDELLENIFCFMLVVEAFSLQKDDWISGSRLTRCQVNMEHEAKLCSPVCSTFEVSVLLQHCHWKELGPFCWNQCWLQTVQFSVHLTDLLNILLRCNGFAGIQKAVVGQMGSRSPYSDHDWFLVRVCLWEVLRSFFSVQLLSWLLPVVIQNPLFIACHNLIRKWFAAVV